MAKKQKSGAVLVLGRGVTLLAPIKIGISFAIYIIEQRQLHNPPNPPLHKGLLN